METEATKRHNGAIWRERGGLVLMTCVRILLGAGMLSYGLSKVFALQFQVTPWVYSRPLGETSGRMLLWATLGYKPWFQVLLGWLETVPALLLLWSRTRRLGAVMMLPVVLNVVLMNFALNLWHDTKVISLFLLALNLLLVLYDLPVYLAFLRGLLAPPLPIGSRRVRLVANTAAMVVPMLTVGGTLAFALSLQSKYITPTADFQGVRQINGAGRWQIESLRVADQPVPVDPATRVMFGFDRSCRIGVLPELSAGTYDVNAARHDFSISKVNFAGSAADWKGTYRADGERLRLEGVREGKPLAMVLLRDHWGPTP